MNDRKHKDKRQVVRLIQMRHKFRWDKKYLYWGITAFCVIACAIVFYMALNYLSGIWKALGTLMSILSPFVWGFVIAYLLRPFCRFFESRLFLPLGGKIFRKSKKAEKHSRSFGRGMAVLLSELVLIAIVTALLWLIIPQLYSSIERIVLNSQTYYDTLVGFVEKFLKDYPEIESYLVSVMGDLSDALIKWAKDSLLPQMNIAVTSITSGVYYILKGIYNIIVGFIVSVYVLYSKETFAAHAKKILYSVFSLEAAERILGALDFTDKTFMGFIVGKILDSAIIGVLCYIVCAILKMPYALLVSVIVGVTNVIPFFGPFIGAIPSALIILMAEPSKCLVFVIFVFQLQQFDGNILGPKILGNTTGINGFWVMFSIILGAGIFGFMGMLIGVPVFVVIYTGIKYAINRKLKRSGLPTDSEVYAKLDHIDPQTGETILCANTEKAPVEETADAK